MLNWYALRNTHGALLHALRTPLKVLGPNSGTDIPTAQPLTTKAS